PFMGKTEATFAVIIEVEERLVIAADVERRPKLAPTSQGAVQRGFDPHSIFSAIRTAVSDQHNLQVHAIALLKAGSLPKTSSGKIQRRLCRELFISGQLEVLAAWPSSAKEL
ncbi:MAG: hypothetical protein HY420_00145, partial [Candidatus Kerfeldbacteria bacterium]|nr:hypothetical protein [Candidatus Kerfeldbacteria bacterium]